MRRKTGIGYAKARNEVRSEPVRLFPASVIAGFAIFIRRIAIEYEIAAGNPSAKYDAAVFAVEENLSAVLRRRLYQMPAVRVGLGLVWGGHASDPNLRGQMRRATCGKRS